VTVVFDEASLFRPREPFPIAPRAVFEEAVVVAVAVVEDDIDFACPEYDSS
jgi:hypothetical protein